MLAFQRGNANRAAADDLIELYTTPCLAQDIQWMNGLANYIDTVS
jgi:hypothetical protein